MLVGVDNVFLFADGRFGKKYVVRDEDVRPATTER